MIFSKKFHLMYQNLSIVDAIVSIKYYFENKNKIIRKLLTKYGFTGVNYLFFDSGRNCLSFILENIKNYLIFLV